METQYCTAAGEKDRSKTTYLHYDHLGSVEVLTDATGEITQQLSFDPWGKRRTGKDWSDENLVALAQDLPKITALNATTSRGFTNHEMLDSLGIIHMNGRTYDPQLARFQQADPIVQAPAYTQNQNRYSYVFNNPLNNVDPSGYTVVGVTPLHYITTTPSLDGGGYGSRFKLSAGNNSFYDYSLAALEQPIHRRHGILTPSPRYWDIIKWRPLDNDRAFKWWEENSDLTSLHVAAYWELDLYLDGQSGYFRRFQQRSNYHQAQSAGSQMQWQGIPMRLPEMMPDDRGLQDAAGTFSSLSGGKFVAGGVIGIGSSTNQEQAKMEAKYAYDNLKNRYLKFAKNNPGVDIDMTRENLNVILRHIRFRTQGMDKHFILSWEYKGQFGAADTFLWREKTLVNRVFNVGGARHYGGDINYIAVGMLAGHYGHSHLLPHMVVAHNLDQYVSEGGEHNLRQMWTGIFWAYYGAFNY